ncbi:hypothetical protein QBC39DRAFT_431393 [Podospora conica]|nr:hypothetical protein QBC39DRAFT_431393 [Schizothecium conicum]
MAAVRQGPPPIVRCDSPPPDTVPEPALGPRADFGRCLSTASTVSHASATTDGSGVRESLGSDFSAFSRQSSGSYDSSRLSDISYTSNALRPKTSTGSLNTVRSGGGSSKRRGYSRPQGTDFAASARSRESVLSLGSIAHLQYYFARTGLLDGKGGQLARKRQQKGQTLDLSSIDTSSCLSPRASGSDHDSSYASMGSSPDLAANGGFLGVTSMVESPVQEHYPGQDDEYSSDEFDEPDPNMLPPTVSTYNYREKPLPKPPSVAEMKADLTSSLDAASQALSEAKDAKDPSPNSQPTTPSTTPQKPSTSPTSWHEIQGMHILDVMTLAIRAAKIYYTTHDRPDRLDAIKSEKAIRSDLLSVMDVLKRMATRGFVGGLRPDEHATMASWVASLRGVLVAEAALEAEELAERRTWTWVSPEPWIGRPPHAREEAFLRSLVPDLPEWTPVDRADPGPTPFLEALKDGVALVQAHNAAVRRTRTRFGAIPSFHADTQKPYRAADNLRYWIKAAELRWEVMLKADALGLQYNADGGEVWAEFEEAVLAWCARVRGEMMAEVEEA